MKELSINEKAKTYDVMGELSIEQKAKAYDEAKARMSKAWNDNRCTLSFMNEIFPETKLSMDEMVRNSLIDLVINYGDRYGNKQNMLTWLENANKNE